MQLAATPVSYWKWHIFIVSLIVSHSFLLEVAYIQCFSPVKHCREGERCGRQQLGSENKKLRAESIAELSCVILEAGWKCLADASRVCPTSWQAGCSRDRWPPKRRSHPAFFSEGDHRLPKTHCSSLFFQSSIIHRPGSHALPSHMMQLDSSAVIWHLYSGHYYSSVSL